MNAGAAGQRMRGPPNGNVNGPPRQIQDQHDAGSAGINGSHPQRAPMSRAERFEDEKKRIIESCFSKKDTDGSGQYLHASYPVMMLMHWDEQSRSRISPTFA